MKPMNFILKCLVFVVISVTLSMNLYSLIACNGAGEGYEGDGEGDAGVCSNISIEMYITTGAIYYLDANSEVQKLLKLVEMQGLQYYDYYEMQRVMARASEKIRNAKVTYESLIQKAETTPYNEAVIAKLAEFNYESFMLENGLNSVVFKEVEGYLKKGDITGVFRRMHSSFTDIANMLDSIENELSQNRMPDLSVYWRLNETFSNTSSFGSCVARMFSSIQ